MYPTMYPTMYSLHSPCYAVLYCLYCVHFCVVLVYYRDVSVRLGTSESFVQFVIKCCSNDDHAALKVCVWGGGGEGEMGV